MQAAVPPMRLAEALNPVGIVAIGSETTAAPFAQPGERSLTDTVLRVRRVGLNVLDGNPATISGSLKPGLARARRLLTGGDAQGMALGGVDAHRRGRDAFACATCRASSEASGFACASRATFATCPRDGRSGA